MSARDSVAMRGRTQPHRACSLRFAAGVASGVLCLGAVLAFAGSAQAQSSGGVFTLSTSTIDAGGGRSTGGVFALEGSIGQHDAGSVQTGGAFALTGGFQQGTAGASGDAIFGNGFEEL